MAEKVRQKTAIVVGAGVGGVSTAARLAKAGFKVTVLEKNDFTGGRCSLIHKDGYRFDQGPSLLLLPQLFHDTFRDLDTSLSAEGVELRKCEPNYNLWFGDGEKFTLSSDLSVMKSEVEKWEGKDGFERYLSFLQESHRHYEISVREVLRKNFTGLGGMLRWSFLKSLFELHPFESIWSRASEYFWTERLRRVFTFGSMYMGMSPFDAPGTYSLLQYTELAEGIWYPIGGFHRIIEALVGIGERLGVEYRLSTPISRILLSPDGSRATGVQLTSGETVTADVVVNNTDLVYAYNNLLASPSSSTSSYAKSLSQRPASCSSISFYWALDTQIPQLSAHNIFLADEYRESFDNIFKRQLIPNEPSFYVNVPSRVDASAAPRGTDAIVVLVPVGHLAEETDDSRPDISVASLDASSIATTGSGAIISPIPPKGGLTPTSNAQDWPAMISLARRTILSTIRARTGVDLGPHILHELTNDPLSWRD
ncbi:ATP-binding cassette transporter CGR1, partial [Elasticomyces elasticus]